jgi:hypothetical protein
VAGTAPAALPRVPRDGTMGRVTVHYLARSLAYWQATCIHLLLASTRTRKGPLSPLQQAGLRLSQAVGWPRLTAWACISRAGAGRGGASAWCESLAGGGGRVGGELYRQESVHAYMW